MLAHISFEDKYSNNGQRKYQYPAENKNRKPSVVSKIHYCKSRMII
jgi:hypothetical protein